MKIECAALLIVAMLGTPARAANPRTTFLLFDTICVSGHLDAKSVEDYSRISANQLKLVMKPVPTNMATMMGGSTKAAWMLAKDKTEVYFLQYTEKPNGTQISHGCAITANGTTSDFKEKLRNAIG